MPRIISSGWKSGDLRIWSGDIENIPNGWELAEEMIDRAVVGAGGQYAKGQKFGQDTSATESRTLSESQLPSHRIPISAGADAGDSGRAATAYANFPRTLYTNYVGASQAHEHGNIDTRQQSIAVIWIRKL